jgi:hypothetical protein
MLKGVERIALLPVQVVLMEARASVLSHAQQDALNHKKVPKFRKTFDELWIGSAIAQSSPHSCGARRQAVFDS